MVRTLVKETVTYFRTTMEDMCGVPRIRMWSNFRLKKSILDTFVLLNPPDPLAGDQYITEEKTVNVVHQHILVVQKSEDFENPYTKRIITRATCFLSYSFLIGKRLSVK